MLSDCSKTERAVDSVLDRYKLDLQILVFNPNIFHFYVSISFFFHLSHFVANSIIERT